MKYIADLHIHSPFSRATSKFGTLAGLFAWARIKGINVVGTGDFTHPGWLSQLKEHLKPAEPGLFKLKDEDVPPMLDNVSCNPISVRFMLTSEISCIYKRDEKVRKVHNLLYVPDFESVERINAKLAAIGNIESDGRPILGLDSRNLLEILLEQAAEGFFVPAHIWTPWFSLFGSKSGFDAIEDCFADLTDHIFALETGLSSDPEMNRMISALDRFTLISNSDCHSPSKLGREANVFDTDLDFFSIREALKKPETGGFKGTIEFFPEEGKYHLDGHRKCGVCLEPEETRKLKSICPVCGRKLTVGVMHRVMELADRKSPKYPKGDPAFRSLIPLPEILGEILGRGPATKGVLAQYSRVISLFGSEFDLLFEIPIEEINTRYSTLLGEAVSRIRTNRVIKNPGFDGEFGKIHVFDQGELDSLAGQISLFSGLMPRKKKVKKPPPSRLPFEKEETAPKAGTLATRSLNPEQKKAVVTTSDRIIVSAGPGTGKTFTLVARLAHLLSKSNAEPNKFTAITFTNKAAEEIRTRLSDEVGEKSANVFVGTFHSFCLDWFRKDDPDIIVIGDDIRDLLLKRLFPKMNQAAGSDLKTRISTHFFHFTTGSQDDNQGFSELQTYLDELDRIKGIDLDSVIPFFVGRLAQDGAFRRKVSSSVEYLFVDEFQDLNRSQYELVEMLAEHTNTKIFAIGDPDQAIYGFRGSDLKFFYNFSEFPSGSTSTLSLTRNYRSAPAIIKAATAVICNNSRQGREPLKPRRSIESLIEYYSAATSKAEAEFVVRRIEEVLGGISHFSIETGRGGGNTHGKEKSFRDIAVLYRLSRQASDLSEALSRRGIPFQLVGATPFFMKQGVRPAGYLARAAADPGAMQEHLALLKEIQGIGPATLNTLERELELRSPDFFSAAGKIVLPPGMDKKIGHVKKQVEVFKETTAQKGLSKAILESFDFLAIDRDLPESGRLVELAGAFGSDLAAFSNHLKQNTSATIYDDRAESVALMTMHAAKGLEFPVVFICGVEEGLIPYNAGRREYDLEEERRLFYVGMTRAMDKLILSSSATRTIFGKLSNQTESRFIKEIPSRLLTRTAWKAKKRKNKPAVQMTLF